MRITLVRPPFYALTGKTNAAHPLSLGYLSAALTEAGEEVAIVDGEVLNFDHNKTGPLTNFKGYLFPYSGASEKKRLLEEIMTDYHHPVWNRVIDRIVSTSPDVVGITCFTVSMTAVKIIVRKIVDKLPGVKVVLGGVHVTSLPEQSLRDLTDVTCLVLGEGENTVVELVKELKKDNFSLSTVNGIAYLDSCGKFVQTSPRELIPDLDDLPLPTRGWNGHRDYPLHLGFTSRGCPYACNFCDSRSIWTRKVRYTSLQRVKDELSQLSDVGVNYFRYADDTFTLDVKRSADWCDLVRANGFNKTIKFSFTTRVELINRERVEDYKSAGVVNIAFGLETGSKRLSKLISKDFRKVDPFEAVKTASDAGISTTTFIMIGHPTETPEDVIETANLIKNLKSLHRNYVDINVVCPYPGTDLWPICFEKSNGKEFINIDTYYKMFHQGVPIINLTDMTDDELESWIQALYRLATLSVFKSRFMMWGGQLVKNPLVTLKTLNKVMFPKQAYNL